MSWNHVSASQIETYNKCKRLWLLKSILKAPEPQKGSQSLGEAFHLIMERVPQGLSYPARTDVAASEADWDKADALAKLALPMLPVDPEKRILREQSIRLDTYPNGPTMVGYIDLAIPIGIGWPALLIPPNEAIIGDYKTLSDFRYMKTPQELADSVQMMTYAKWAIEPPFDTAPEHVRLVHLYARTRPPIIPSSIRYESAIVTPDEINTRWEKTLDIVREMQQVSACTNADDVEATGALNGHCEAYGGCSFRDKCGIAPSSGIKTLFQIGKKPTSTQEETPMAGSPILDKIKAARAAQGLTTNPSATPAANSPATPVPSTDVAGSASPGTAVNSAPVASGPESASGSVKPSNQPASTLTVKGPVSGLVARIQAKGKGSPVLAGAIAQTFEKETGQKAVGQGDLSTVTVNTLPELMKLASGIVPPEAPSRAQAVITKPGDAVVDPLKAEDDEEGEDDGEDSNANVAAATPTASPSVAATGSVSTGAPVAAVVQGKRGRPSKDELAAREAAQKKAFEDAVNAEVVNRLSKLPGDGGASGYKIGLEMTEEIGKLQKEIADLQATCEAAHTSNAKLVSANEELTAKLNAGSTQPVKEGLTLYVDCFPTKGGGEIVDFFEWIGPICAAVAQQNNVGDWRQINYTSKGLLANAIREVLKAEGPPKAMTISTYAGGADIALEILTPLAKRVIKKV